MGAKEKIIDASIRMFNEKGATNVSTAQIAQQLGMSNGNLYYHFHNKEHIIREIWDARMQPELNKTVYKDELKYSEIGYIQSQQEKAAVIYRYRFFYYELHTLLQNDPELKQSYQRRTKIIINQFVRMFDSWVALEMMSPVNNETKMFLAETNFTFAQIWMPYKQIINDGQSPQSALLETFENLRELMRPYFTDMTNERIDALIAVLEPPCIEFPQPTGEEDDGAAVSS